MRCISICLFCFLLTTGCGIFQKKQFHYNSCGPEALFYAFKFHNIKSSRHKISKEILEDHKAYSLLRDFLSVFRADLKEITFPQEIKSQLLKNKIKVQSVSVEVFKKLKKNKNTTAIILINPKDELGKYHWVFYPTQSSSPLSFFGYENTNVDRIYILSRVN